MKTLPELIQKYGEPNALIDHWDENSKRFAIWGFEEIYCKKINELDSENPLHKWQTIVNDWKSNASHPEICAIGGFSYALKCKLFPHIPFKNHASHLPAIWFGKPKMVHEYKLAENDTVPATRIQMTADIPNERRYENDISTIKHHQEIGDIYQINYTHPKHYAIDGNPFNLYLSLREIAKPLCGIYINTGKFQLLSASPERFFKTDNAEIRTYPIKGTRKRCPNPIDDERIAKELFHSEKDRAEHLMIVDLLRNDLGRICNFGSIETNNLYKIESFETVHHMVTEVVGNLNPNVSESAIMSALFPGGSITGAPKERAMEIIDAIEDYNRNFYTGALGYIAPNGNMDMNIAIRTMTITNSNGVYPVGGGIVWDSNPKSEWEEAHHKGAIIDKLIHQLKETHHA